MIQSFSPKGRHWLLVLACVIALLQSQTLGLLHKVVHYDDSLEESALTVQTHVQPHDSNQKSDHTHPVVTEAGLLTLLFSSHHSVADCQAYDSLCHLDATHDFAASVLPLVLQIFVLILFAGLAKARWHALFQARGPPSTR